MNYPCVFCHRPSEIQIIESFDEPPEALCHQCLQDTRPDYFDQHQSRRLEYLLSRVIKFHQYNDTQIIIEFDATSIAYEKKLQALIEDRPNLGKDIIVPIPGVAPFIIYQSINPKTSINIPILRCGYKSDVNFSESMRHRFRDFQSQLTKNLAEQKAATKRIYEKIENFLGVEKYTYRDWTGVKELLPFTLFWPFYPLYQAARGQGSFKTLLAPYFFLQELVRGVSTTNTSNRIGSIHNLFVIKVGKANVGLHLEPRGSNSEKFERFRLEFNDGTSLGKDSAYFWEISTWNSSDPEPNFYIKVDPTLKAELDQYLVADRNAFYQSIEFESSLSQNDHLMLLKHFKFV